MRTSVTPIRVLRLCLKELRESLRDRRTIVTLILMPLLVYPLLSLVLNRVLLTSASGKSESFVTIGLGAQLQDTQIANVLHLGFVLLNDREASPVFVEPVVEDGKPRTSKNPLPSALPSPQLLPLSDDGRIALRNNSIDIVITQKVPSEEEAAEEKPTRGQPVKRSVQSLFRRYGELKSLPDKLDVAATLDLVGQLEIRYRKGDWRSERALQLLERMLAALNNETAFTAMGNRFEAPFRLVATPVQMRSNYAGLLSTMVPLVLVLMTMAGAVYPAIDLTAGERERGTMEALIVSPMPSYVLLLSKYSAVVTVALLTALANLLAMTVTLWVSGIGKLVFGDGTISTSTIGTVLVLLVLFTMFFAALLLAVTSFAKSFKEAQAYLIPLMLLALTPGVMSLLPDIKFTTLLATVPLVNIVLLAREILVGEAEWNVAMVAVICNCIYALAALAVASRLFGSDASMHGSKGSWQDLFSRPKEGQLFPNVDQMALTMAFMFPLYFIASSSLPKLGGSLAYRLGCSAVVSFVLIMALPLMVALYRRIDLNRTFRLYVPAFKTWLLWIPAIFLIGGSSWMVAHEIIIFSQEFGIASISNEQLERVAEFNKELHQLSLVFILVVFAFTPAICEEFLFRGFVLSSLHKYSITGAIVLSAVLFGLMHVLTSQVLAVERFLPTTFMGLILAFVALRTGSLWPGIVLHALHNGLLLSAGHFSEQIKSLEILNDKETHLPQPWLIGGSLALLVGLSLVWFGSRMFGAARAGLEDGENSKVAVVNGGMADAELSSASSTK